MRAGSRSADVPVAGAGRVAVRGIVATVAAATVANGLSLLRARARWLSRD